MPLYDVLNQLDNLIVAHFQDRKLSFVTRNDAVVRQAHSELRAKRLVYDRKTKRRTYEYSEMYDMQVRNAAGCSFTEFVTYVGLTHRLVKIARDLKVPLTLVDTNRDEQLENAILAPPLEYFDVETIFNDAARDWQLDVLRLMRVYRSGRIKAATGAGKSHLIADFCQLAKTTRILVTTGAIPDLENLYGAILGRGVDVSKVTGSSRSRSSKKARVVCCTAGSLTFLEDQHFDVLIGDESHTQAAETQKLNLFTVNAERAFGLSANQDERRDKADDWVEAIYGPLIFGREYADNQEAGDVVPIEYRFIETRCSNVVRSRSDAVRERNLIVRNQARNKDIARVAKYYLDQGKQVLVVVRTSEHCLRIHKELPELLPVFKAPTPKRVEEFVKQGLVYNSQKKFGYTGKQLPEIQEKFRNREIMGVVVNSLWHKAKDFPDLEVVVRGDAMSSKEANTQISGRASRKGRLTNKQVGYLVDCEDGFDDALKRRASARRSFYKKQGWKPMELQDGN